MRVRPFITSIAAGTATAFLSAGCVGGDGVGPPPDPPSMATTIRGYVRSAVDSTPVPGMVVTACEEYTEYDRSQGVFVTTPTVVGYTRSELDGSYQLFLRASCRILSHVYLTVSAVPSPTAYGEGRHPRRGNRARVRGS